MIKTKSPILYDKNETNFMHLGLGVLSDCIEAIVTEERNGIYILEMKYKINGYLSEQLMEENIIKCRASYKWDNQRFIIKSVKESSSYIEVYAEHEIYKVNDNQIQPNTGVNNRDALTTLRQWKNLLIDANNFEVYSDIETLNSAFWDIDDYANAKEVLAGKEGSILDIWGGEYEFDNNLIYLWKARGGEIYTPVAYGRNITDREQERNIESTYTTIYPYAKYQKKDSSGNVVEGAFNVVTVPGYYIDCENASNFKNRKIQKIDFSQQSTSTDGEGNALPLTPTELKNLAVQYMKSNNFGVPKIHIEVSFIDLAKDSINQGENTMEQYNLCDLVPVWLVKQGIQVKAKIIKTEWNVLTNSYEKLTLGDAKDDFRVAFNNVAYTAVNQAVKKNTEGIVNQIIEISSALVSDVEEVKGQVLKVSTDLGNIHLNIDEKINEKSTIYRSEYVPAPNNIGDLWLKPIDDYYEFYQYDSGNWQFIIDTKKVDNVEINTKLERLNNSLESLQSDMASNVTAVNARLENINNEVTEAKNIASDALTISENNTEQLSELTELIGNSANTLKQIQVIIEMLGNDPEGNLVLEVAELREKSKNFIKNIQIRNEQMEIWTEKDNLEPSIILKLPKSFTGDFDDLSNVPDLVTFTNAKDLEVIGFGNHIVYKTESGTAIRRR